MTITNYIFVTANTPPLRIVLPPDFSSTNTVECYGAGQDGLDGSYSGGPYGGGTPQGSLISNCSSGNGGHGGSYSIVSNFNWVPGQVLFCYVGANGPTGQDTWVNSAANSAPSSTTNGVLAPGGSSSTTAVATTNHAGGSGGTGRTTGNNSNNILNASGGGGGGCGGPSGNGQNGGNGTTATNNNNLSGGNGGYANNSGATVGQAGSAGRNGSGAGGGGSDFTGRYGGQGVNHAIYPGVGFGPGGGGGGASGNFGSPGFGATGGGGGGAGASTQASTDGSSIDLWWSIYGGGACGGLGLIVISYTSTFTTAVKPHVTVFNG